jgi:activator of 2-hydroxyglutaryl-CoA dehydratase
MNTFLGLDIGSVNIKACLINQDGQLLKKEQVRINSDAVSAVNSVIDRLGNPEVTGLGISGSGTPIIPVSFNAGKYTSPLAVSAGLLHEFPAARTIIQLGGHSSLIVRLEDGLKKPWKVATNPLCAAGTGRFIEQQAYRLGIRWMISPGWHWNTAAQPPE